MNIGQKAKYRCDNKESFLIKLFFKNRCDNKESFLIKLFFKKVFGVKRQSLLSLSAESEIPFGVRKAQGKLQATSVNCTKCKRETLAGGFPFLPLVKFQHLIHRWRGPPSRKMRSFSKGKALLECKIQINDKISNRRGELCSPDLPLI